MVGKWHQCVGCMKNLSSYHSLWRHKKTCKGAGNSSGSGLLYSTSANRPQVNHVGETSGNLVRGSKKIDPTEMDSGSTGDDHCVDDAMDASSTAGSDDGDGVEGTSDDEEIVDGTGSDEESVDGTGSDEDGVNDDDFDLWENFVEFTIEIKKWSIFDTLCYFLIPYYLRSEDDIYKEIVHDVEEALHYQNMNYLEALSSALEKNKQIILKSIANAKGCDVGDSFDIWCALAARKSNTGCRWLSYSPCYCDECKRRACMISYLKYLLLMFHYMDMDDVVQDIIISIKKLMDDDDGELTLRDASHIAVEKHENVILEKVREAET